MKLSERLWLPALALVAAWMAVMAIPAEAGARGFGGIRSDEGVVEGPRGGAVAEGPDGGIAVRRPGEPSVAALPDGAARVTVRGQDYFVVGDTYYRSCLVGADMHYCVVEAPVADDDSGDDDDDDVDDDDS